MGNVDGAGQTIAGDLTSAYEALASTLIMIRNDASATITATQDDAARMADAARFFVVLLVPVMILVAYRYHVRRVRRQEELERELDRERIASRTKSDFIAEMSHQLRTPLAGIYGSALELRDPAIGANAELSELAKLITRQSAALTKLVENTLTLATADQGQLIVDVREMNPVTEIVGALESLDVVGHTTSQELTPGVVIADPHYFRQVVSNLASNAHRYGQEPVEVRGGISGDGYVIEVIDSGDGTDVDDEQRHLNRHVPGAVSPLATEIADLDLLATEILVARMGGAIEYERRDGKAVFTVWLPRA
jgi:signal transduction histidine kinase